MELLVDKVGDVKVITPKVEFLDASNSKEFKDRMAALLEGKVVVDLQHVQFIDSSGCGAILTFLKQLTTSGGDLKLCGITNPVRALFDLVRMNRIVDVTKTCDEAVQAYAGEKK